jgi:hypothetical protein
MMNANVSNSIHNVLSSSSSQVTKANPYTSPTTRPIDSPSSVVKISPEAQWANIASKYDVSNISPNEVKVMAKELFDNNLISEKESLLMYLPSSIDENPNQKYDYLEGMHKDLNTAVREGYVTQKEGIMEKRITIFERIKELNSQGTS